MKNKTIAAVAGGAVAAVAIAAGAGVAQANADDDATEVPITGEALDHASSVALDHTGEGRVTGTEEGDEDSYYEVEVTLDDGSQVDVQLDEQFKVVTSKADSETDG